MIQGYEKYLLHHFILKKYKINIHFSCNLKYNYYFCKILAISKLYSQITNRTNVI